MLRLAGSITLATCPTCKGKGRVPCPRVMASRSLNRGCAADTAGEGCPIPCPECLGKRVVAAKYQAIR